VLRLQIRSADNNLFTLIDPIWSTNSAELNVILILNLNIVRDLNIRLIEEFMEYNGMR